MTKLQALRHSDLDEDAILKQSTALSRADDNFVASHNSLLYDDPDANARTMAAELDDHETAVDSLSRQLKLLSHLHDASELVVAMDEALLIMEQSVGKPYYAARAAELVRTRKAVDDFREARNKPGARNNTDLIAIRDNAVDRLRDLDQAHHDSIPPPPSFSAAAPAAVATPLDIKPPKLEFPIFNGLVEHYLDWRSLFNALLKKTSTISEEEKKVHLLRAMGTPEAHSLASHAINSSVTYAAALKRLDERYFKKRLIFSTHLTNMLQGGTVSYCCDDLRKLYDRIDLNL